MYWLGKSFKSFAVNILKNNRVQYANAGVVRERLTKLRKQLDMQPSVSLLKDASTKPLREQQCLFHLLFVGLN